MNDILTDTLTTRDDAINLRKQYPLSKLSIFRRSWHWLFIYVDVVGLLLSRALFAAPNSESGNLFTQMFNWLSFYLIFGGLAVITAKLFYEVLYYCTYQYVVDSGGISVVEGVLIRVRSSYPLTKITDVYLDRNWIEVICLLWNLNIATPNPASFGFGQIRGLRRDVAVALSDYLNSLLDTVHPEAERAVEVTPSVDVPVGGSIPERIIPDFSDDTSEKSEE